MGTQSGGEAHKDMVQPQGLWGHSSLGSPEAHTDMESSRLEKTLKIIRPNCAPSTTSVPLDH